MPLDQLCQRLADGYARAAAFALTGLTTNDCVPGFASDQDLVRFHAGDPARLRQAMCDPDGGPLFVVARAVARGEAQGRLNYDEIAAETCTQAGRTATAGAGGLAAFALAARVDGGLNASVPTLPAFVAACSTAVAGRQGQGQVCANDLECAQGDGGAQCHGRGGAACEGTCRPKGPVGAPCGPGLADCWDDLRCVGGSCVAPVALGASCQSDAGELPCPSGLFCRGGVCAEGGREDAGCVSFIGSDCANGYFCNEESKCEPRRAQGAGCTEDNAFDSPCQSCLGCFVPVLGDGGVVDSGGALPGTCQSFAGMGESCVGRPCHLAFTCLAGTCQARARTGQACVLEPGDATLRGNCLSLTDACQGSPSTCQTRPLPGEVCTATAGTLPTTGNCDTAVTSGVWCLRAQSQDTTGFCRGAAGLGQACGNVQNLPPNCFGNASCSVSQDGGVGVCLPAENVAAGGGCVRDSQCVRGHYCADGDAGVGTCTPGGSLSDPCTGAQPWGNICVQGVCTGGVCIAALGEGATCSTTTQCGSTLRCESTDAGRVCSPRLSLGERCDTSTDCANGLTCNNGECVGEACAPGASTDDSCVQPGAVTAMLFFGALVGLSRRRRR